ncbi:type IV toxin-antitoxin system AbiEi family antitoxin domain-containing protein [Micromonospora sp. WMMD1155]|uniref:type IV toxin-antitoxin system AbiEi family antitoxin domain-containing protein n=1 Tax=Micromonospora sp. WMMD1155 TaxID=3016094 RepID=UPI00249A214C|nr:type IV toxin-antitoxin system AbiEi family antitoxin domain-containing protein [Micromonospora sp. WMMD1155]WFE50864.1 type IV toxin-antitoxin system AbiEi family antitoxin domain-containing protein [Micromonospora sp. WMMD1155]
MGSVDRAYLVRSIAAAQDDLITRAQALRAGLSRHDIDHLVAVGRWRALARSVYLTVGRDGEPAARRCRIRAAVLSFGPAAHAVFGTAAELYGIAGLPRRDEIHVALPGRAAKRARASDPAIVLHQLEHPPGNVVQVNGIAATEPRLTVSEIILRERRYAAVSVLDSALSRGLLTTECLAVIPSLIQGRRGAVAARGYLAEADGRAQSPLETRSRLRCVDGGVPPDTLQLEVRDDDGYLLGIGDLGWRGPRLIAEADGRDSHSSLEAVYADRRRQNRLVNAGWTILRFTWQDTLHPAYIPQTVRQAIATARSR